MQFFNRKFFIKKNLFNDVIKYCDSKFEFLKSLFCSGELTNLFGINSLFLSRESLKQMFLQNSCIQ